MTAAQFRRIALGLKDAVEASHMAHPDFRVGNRVFATLHKDGLHGMVKVPPQEQERFVSEFPSAFALEAGAWGRAGCTRVTLKTVDEDALGEAITLAWQRAVAEGPTKSKARRLPIRR